MSRPTEAEKRWARFDKNFLGGCDYHVRAKAKSAFDVGAGTNEVMAELERKFRELEGEYAVAVLESQRLGRMVKELKRKLENAELLATTSDRGRAAFKKAYEEGRAMIKKLQKGAAGDEG